jgi:uncharacterized protein YwqG
VNADRQARLDRKLSGLARTRYVPKIETGEAKTTVSKFAGAAWLETGKPWPKCRSCKRPMHLLLQLRAGDAPEDTVQIPASSLLQIFHCGTSECDYGDVTHGPGGTGVLMRVVAEKAGKPTTKVPDGMALSRRIVGFAATSELPGADEARASGVRCHAKDLRAMRQRGPLDGTKLGGWPMWIQSPDQPTCRKCDAPMRFVLQLQSEHYIGVGWGDSGLAYVHQCTQHPKELAFSWSST